MHMSKRGKFFCHLCSGICVCKGVLAATKCVVHMYLLNYDQISHLSFDKISSKFKFLHCISIKSFGQN